MPGTVKWSPLNWKELAAAVHALNAQVEGLFVDKIIVPERPRFSDGYLKGEWCIRLSGRKTEKALLVGVRPRFPYLALYQDKSPRAAPTGTRSAFDLALGKHVQGARIEKVEALPRERTVLIRLAGSQEKLALVLNLIPSVPEALLVTTADEPWHVLARSRITKEREVGGDRFTPPDGSRAPESPAVREELTDPQEYLRALNEALDREAFELRMRAATKAIRERLHQAEERIRQNETAAAEAAREPEWKRFGDLLKNVLAEPPPIRNGARQVMDFETGAYVDVPSDPKLSPQQQVEKFYQLARRKARRAEEAHTRIRSFSETLERLKKAITQAETTLTREELKTLETAAGIAPVTASAPGAPKKKIASWLGKTALSKEGWAIWVGRSRDENLELTFKHARGNDLWMHIRGRPGAHVVIPVQPGKSVPLETLLDAANLAIYYSGGEKWGKTEVDYTFKKYVKRIKDSTEASYTQNKTLLVQPDPARLKRLLGGETK